MRMRISDDLVQIVDVDNVQSAILKSWSGIVAWNRKTKMWEGRICGELLNRLSSIVRLPAPIEAERQRMNKVQEAVDFERTVPAEELKPLTDYPVTKNLYAHQTRAANMALLTFGLVDWQEVYEK